MNHKLFENFEPVSTKQWKQQIQYEQKGADYQELVWETPENLKIKPFYHVDQAISNNIENNSEPFQIIQPIFVHNVEKSIKKANDSLQRGAESLLFTIENDSISVSDLLKGITQQYKQIFISMAFFQIL